MHCNCTDEHNVEWHEDEDGYGTGVSADRMRYRDALADAINALGQADHYGTMHEGVIEVDGEREHVSSLLRRMMDATRVLSDDHESRL